MSGLRFNVFAIASLVMLLTNGCGDNKKESTDSSGLDGVEEIVFNGRTIRYEPFLTYGTIIRHVPSTNKLPVTVAILNDSEDLPFVYSVDHIVNSFMQACKIAQTREAMLQSALIVNSRIAAEKANLLVCKPELNYLSEVALDFSVPKMIEELSKRNKTIEKLKAEYLKHPLLSSEVLARILEQVASPNLFPSKKYVYFFDVFAHGSEEYMMAGLPKEVVDAKNDYTRSFMTKHGMDLKIIDKLPKYGETGKDFDQKTLTYPSFETFAKLGFGQLKNDYFNESGAPKNDFDSPKNNFLSKNDFESPKNDFDSPKNDFDSPKNDPDSGLPKNSLDEGMPKNGISGGPGKSSAGHGPAYGLTHVEFFKTLVEFMLPKNSAQKREIGFLMIESCSSNLTSNNKVALEVRNLVLGAKAPILGYYSPAGLIDPRNIDWNTLFLSHVIAAKDAPATQQVGIMQKLLHRNTQGIVNYKKIEVGPAK